MTHSYKKGTNEIYITESGIVSMFSARIIKESKRVDAWAAYQDLAFTVESILQSNRLNGFRTVTGNDSVIYLQADGRSLTLTKYGGVYTLQVGKQLDVAHYKKQTYLVDDRQSIIEAVESYILTVKP